MWLLFSNMIFAVMCCALLLFVRIYDLDVFNGVMPLNFSFLNFVGDISAAKNFHAHV